jgi:hypothetical protein
MFPSLDKSSVGRKSFKLSSRATVRTSGSKSLKSKLRKKQKEGFDGIFETDYQDA